MYSSHVQDRGTDASLNLPYFCIYDSSGWASVMVLPWEHRKGVASSMWIWDKRVSYASEGVHSYRKKEMVTLSFPRISFSSIRD